MNWLKASEFLSLDESSSNEICDLSIHFFLFMALGIEKNKTKSFLFYGDFPCMTKLFIFIDRTSPSLVDIFLQVFMKKN